MKDNKFKNKKYSYVNPKTEVAAAGYKHYVTPANEIIARCSKNTYDMSCEAIHNIKYDPDEKFEAMAKCDDRDTYDPRVGKSVAVAKSDMKYHRFMANSYYAVLKRLKKAYDEIYTLYRLHLHKYYNCEESIAKYMGDSDE